ncbi:hypothetical protein FRB99_001729 [Tulasnella sp. 403]|nr:hypothetical protein FRB99_001729 [Tulasnella sp. 403]
MNIVFLPQTLLPRLIIYAVFTALLMFCTLLPIPPLRHSSLRTCSALTGSAGIVITIALFSTIPSWSSPWLTLAIQDYVGYRNAKEKGLSAALSVLTILGAAVDWLLKLKLGENPDKEWDAYLARYSREFPFASERAGKFEPLQSIWTRMFKGHHTGNEDHEILFPPDSQLLPTHKVDGFSEKKFSATPPPAFRPYLPSRKRSMLTKSRSPALATLPDISSDSSDDEHGLKPKPPTFRPWLPKRLSTGNSVTTLVASLAENTRLTPPAKLGTTGVEDYSDVEQDVTAAKVEDRSSPDWKPAFIRKHEEEVRRSASLKSQKEPKDAPKPTVATDHVNKNGNSDLTDPPRLTESPIPLSRQNTERSNGSSPASSTHLSASPKRQPSLTRITTTPAPLPMPIPMGSVPATPSLIRAYDRIQRAQQEATQNSPSGTPLGSPPTRRGTRTSTGGLDEAFWLNVRAKAGGTRGTP